MQKDPDYHLTLRRDVKRNGEDEKCHWRLVTFVTELLLAGMEGDEFTQSGLLKTNHNFTSYAALNPVVKTTKWHRLPSSSTAININWIQKPLLLQQLLTIQYRLLKFDQYSCPIGKL